MASRIKENIFSSMLDLLFNLLVYLGASSITIYPFYIRTLILVIGDSILIFIRNRTTVVFFYSGYINTFVCVVQNAILVSIRHRAALILNKAGYIRALI